MSEQAVLIRFVEYGARCWAEREQDLGPMYELEDDMQEVLEAAGLGEVDGHELAFDGSDGMYFIYGPDARAIFTAIEGLLRGSRITCDAEVLLRFGDPEDPDVREEIIKLGGPAPQEQ